MIVTLEKIHVDGLDISPKIIFSLLYDLIFPVHYCNDVMDAISLFILNSAGQENSIIARWKNQNEELCSFTVQEGGANVEAFVESTPSRIDESDNVLAFNEPQKALSYAASACNLYDRQLKVVVGEGILVNNSTPDSYTELKAKIDNGAELLHFYCLNGLSNHIAMSRIPVADAVAEALDTFLGWDVYYHGLHDHH